MAVALDTFVYYYPFVLDILGILFNGLCLVIFCHVLYKGRVRGGTGSGHMFKYMAAKACCDCLYFMFLVNELVYFCDSCRAAYESYAANVWYIGFYNYGAYVLEFASGLFDVAATFDCLISINKWLPGCLSALWFWLVCGTIGIGSAVLHVDWILRFWIRSKEVSDRTNYNPPVGNATRGVPVRRVVFFLDKSDLGFYREEQLNLVDTARALLRDGLFLLVLVLLNALILVSLKQATARRRHLAAGKTASPSSSSGPSSSLVQAAQRAERNKIVMIGATCLNYALGHLPFMAIVACNTFIYNRDRGAAQWFAAFIRPIRAATLFFYHLSFITPLLLYVTFNSSFRSTAWQLCQLFRCRCHPPQHNNRITVATNNLATK